MTIKLRLTTILALSLAVFPIAGHSQDSTGTDTQAPDPASTLTLGEEIVDGLAVGTTYTRENHGDWEMRCVRTPDLKDPCQLYQLMQNSEGVSVAEISLFQLPVGQAAVAGATIAVPLGTLLTEQLTLSIDGGGSKRYPFSWCTVQGCYARIGLTSDDIIGFRLGSSASVSIVPVAAANQFVTLTLSLSGFTNGFAAVQASNAALSGE